MTTPLTVGGKRSPLLRLQTLASEVAMELVNSPPDDPADYVPIILGLKQIAGELAVARREAEQQLIRRTARGDHPVAGWMIRRSQAWERKEWRHEDLALELRNAGAGLTEVVRCAGITYWRGDRNRESGTYEWGIDRDEFCAKRRVETVAIEKARL